jgi:predicted lipid-binding transport protein (Tim44 family)
VAAALTEIALADRSFTAEHFLEGARRAYEMIVTAFARGERETLRPLLSNDVYAAFEQVIADREAHKYRVEFTLVGFREVKIAGSDLKKSVAEITVSFTAQFNSATFDADGALVEGDPKLLRDVVDIWTFERNVREADPNWKLVATSGEAGLQEH